MANQNDPPAIREYISQPDLDRLMESAFVEQAEAADELELELSDLAETSALDASDGEDPGFISNDDIGALFKGAGAKGESKGVASQEDVGSLVSQSDIDALLRGKPAAVTPLAPAKSELKDDIRELISQEDIDALLKGSMTAAPADRASETVDGGDGTVSQSDRVALLSGAQNTSEAAGGAGLISQSDIDALLGGPANKASEGEDTFEPQERNEDGDVISQSDIDALLKGAMATEEAGTRNGRDIGEGVKFQSDIDSRLGASQGSESLEEREPSPEQVILADAMPEIAAAGPAAPVLSRRRYTRRLYQIGAMAALILIISSSALLFTSRFREDNPKPVVLRFAIQKPESQTVMERVPGNASVTLSGFLVLAPSDINDITCLFADLQLDFPDSSMVKIIKDNEIVVRNLIYSVINDAMLSSSKKAIEKTALALAVREALGHVIPREMIRTVSFGKFEMI